MELPIVNVCLISADYLGMPVVAEIPNTLQEFKKQIHCDTLQGLTNRRLGRHLLDIYIDDNGKLGTQDTLSALFVRGDKVIDYVLGNIIIATHDEEGDTTDFPQDYLIDLVDCMIPSESLSLPANFPYKVNDNILLISC